MTRVILLVARTHYHGEVIAGRRRLQYTLSYMSSPLVGIDLDGPLLERASCLYGMALNI